MIPLHITEGKDTVPGFVPGRSAVNAINEQTEYDSCRQGRFLFYLFPPGFNFNFLRFIFARFPHSSIEHHFRK